MKVEYNFWMKRLSDGRDEPRRQVMTCIVVERLMFLELR